MAILDEIDEYARVCLYGPPGVGKTTAMATLAHLGPVTYLDIERRLKGSPLRRLGVPTNRIDVERDWKFNLVYEHILTLRKKLYSAKVADKPLSDVAAAFVLDSATEATALWTRGAMEEYHGKVLEKAKRFGEVPVINPFTIERDHYGIMTEQWRMILRQLRDLPMHLGFTASERRDVDDDGSVLWGPNLSPAAQLNLTLYVDIIGHMEYMGPYRVARFQRRDSKWMAKDSFGVLPQFLVNPTMLRITQYISGELDESNDLEQMAFLEGLHEAATDMAEAAESAVREGA